METFGGGETQVGEQEELTNDRLASATTVICKHSFKFGSSGDDIFVALAQLSKASRHTLCIQNSGYLISGQEY